LDAQRRALFAADQEDLEQGDSTLQLKPLLRFPGPVLWMEMDPTQQYLVTDSREPTGRNPRPEKFPVLARRLPA